MLFNVHRNYTAYQGRRDGCSDRYIISLFLHLYTPVWRWRKREIIYLSLHCHHQNDSCIKMGSDENHFAVSLIVSDKVTRKCPQNTAFLNRKESRSRIEPRPFAYQPNVLPPATPAQIHGLFFIYRLSAS